MMSFSYKERVTVSLAGMWSTGSLRSCQGLFGALLVASLFQFCPYSYGMALVRSPVEVRCVCQSRSTRAETGHQPLPLQHSVALEISTHHFRFLGAVFCWVVWNLPLQSSRGNSEQIFLAQFSMVFSLRRFCFSSLICFRSSEFTLLLLSPLVSAETESLYAKTGKCFEGCGGGEPWCECDTPLAFLSQKS